MLFGHQNDDKAVDTDMAADVPAPTPLAVNPLAVDPDSGISLPVVPEELEHDTEPDTPFIDQPHATADTPPLPPEHPEPLLPPQTPAHTRPLEDSDVLSPSTDDDLLNLKQQALQQLSPLIGHLDQTPEEKFRTTMMMIQSSDNQALVKDAYTAAQAIGDDKARAQALLDIVNEINYFTQQTQAE